MWSSANLLVRLYVGSEAVFATRDSNNLRSTDVLPAVLPHPFVAVCTSKLSEIIHLQCVRLEKAGWSASQIHQLEEDNRGLPRSFYSEALFKEMLGKYVFQCIDWLWQELDAVPGSARNALKLRWRLGVQVFQHSHCGPGLLCDKSWEESVPPISDWSFARGYSGFEAIRITSLNNGQLEAKPYATNPVFGTFFRHPAHSFH